MSTRSENGRPLTRDNEGACGESYGISAWRGGRGWGRRGRANERCRMWHTWTGIRRGIFHNEWRTKKGRVTRRYGRRHLVTGGGEPVFHDLQHERGRHRGEAVVVRQMRNDGGKRDNDTGRNVSRHTRGEAIVSPHHGKPGKSFQNILGMANTYDWCNPPSSVVHEDNLWPTLFAHMNIPLKYRCQPRRQLGT